MLSGVRTLEVRLPYSNSESAETWEGIMVANQVQNRQSIGFLEEKKPKQKNLLNQEQWLFV